MISSMVKFRKRLHFSHLMLAFCLFFLSIQTNPSHAQTMEYVVFSIEGSVEDLSLGQVLTEGYRFEVPGNATVNLISKQGEIITLTGPAVATVTTDENNKEGEEALASISKLLFNDNKFIQIVGGTRSVGDETDIQNLQASEPAWLPALSKARTYCFAPGKAIFHRETAKEDLFLQLENNEVIHWKSEIHKLDLSEYLDSNSENSVLNLSINGRAIQVFISAKRPLTVAEQVAWLASKGCTQQALRLLASKIPS